MGLLLCCRLFLYVCVWWCETSFEPSYAVPPESLMQRKNEGDRTKGMQDREAAGFERAFSAHASWKIAEIHTSIPAIFHFTWTKKSSLKTALHLKKRAFSVRRGEKRRNTGVVFRAFSTKHDGKISFFRLPDPYLACPKGGAFHWEIIFLFCVLIRLYSHNM